MTHKTDTEGELDASDADTKFQEALAQFLLLAAGGDSTRLTHCA